MMGLHSRLHVQTSPAIFGQLCHLLQQFAQPLPDALVLMDIHFRTLPQAPVPPDVAKEFVLVWSVPFKVLLLGRPHQERRQPQPTTQSQSLDLTFFGEEIVAFGKQLCLAYPQESLLKQFLAHVSWAQFSNDLRLQGEFTLQLIHTFSQGTTGIAPEQSCYPAVSVCQPIEQALQRQVAQDRLLSQVSAQIRQSLDLDVILQTAINEVKQFLQVDRVVIYQIYPQPSQLPQPSQSPQPPDRSQSSQLSYSSALSQVLSQVLHEGVPAIQSLEASHYRVFQSVSSSLLPDAGSAIDPTNVLPLVYLSSDWLAYEQGHCRAVDDVQQAYQQLSDLGEAMQRQQIRAWMTMPILVQSQLWGLMTVHQCDRPRSWQAYEQESLMHIAEHLAIAIYQAQLYQQLQQQKRTLELRVQQYTQDLQTALLATQAATQAKTEFLATMSHELRTPLACVIGMSSTLLHWSFGPLNQRQRNYLQTIHDSGEHLLEIINDILEFSQLESGKTVLNLSQFPLTRIVYTCKKMFEEKAKLANIDLQVKVHLTPSQDLFVADARRLQQILTQLISNAIKFTSPEGQVIVTVWREDRCAVFQVEDTGIGIAKNQQSLLFKKFQQLDTSLRREHSGTGLGLALAKQFVDLHNGRIEVESEVGVGSKFTVRLPSQAPRKGKELSPHAASISANSVPANSPAMNTPAINATGINATATNAISTNAISTSTDLMVADDTISTNSTSENSVNSVNLVTTHSTATSFASTHNTRPPLPIPGQVVLLEDEDETATLICELLTAVGYQVVWLVDGATAIDQIQLLQPSVVIVNLNLISDHFIAHLRQSAPFQTLKVLGLVSDEPAQDTSQNLMFPLDSPPSPQAVEAKMGARTIVTPPATSAKNKADLYLGKPLDLEQLVSSLMNLTTPLGS